MYWYFTCLLCSAYTRIQDDLLLLIFIILHVSYSKNAFNDRSFRATTISAVKAATKRSMQLGGVSPEVIEYKHNL
jgi:hypothetical protein